MAGFDVAAGIHESALNSILPQVYDALHSTLLKGNINVNEAGITSIDFDFKASPTVSLQPSDEAKQHIKTEIENITTGPEMSSLHEIASSATFTAKVSDIAFTIHYKKGSLPTTIPSASLVAHVSFTVDGTDSNLTVRVLRATVAVPKNSIFTELLNRALVPYLIDHLNTKILHQIQIPPIAFKSLHISTPLPVIQQSFFTAFSSLGSTPSTIPSPLPWPKDGTYVAVDIPAIETASKMFFPLGPHDEFSWHIFSGHVGATLNPPKIANISNDGSISASIEANASCQLKVKTPFPLPDITIGPSATAGLSSTLRPIVEKRELKVVLESVGDPTFSFDWGIPHWLSFFFNPLEAALAAAINDILCRLIRDKLGNLKIPVYSIPGINIHVEGDTKIEISIDKAEPSGLDGSMLVVTAVQTTVSKH